MSREELIRVLRGASSSDEIDGEILKDYHFHFFGTTEEQREKVFDRNTRELIGKANKREWDKVTSLMEDGYNNIETPTGHRLYRHRKSKLYHKWQELIPDNMPTQQCKDIFKDICDRWEPKLDVEIQPEKLNAYEVPF